MKLEGIHHITAITGDAPRNVEFYVGTLGLRMVKKTVNQDDPTIYHLFYGDEEGSPGMDLTFFEYPGAAPGQAGDGMVRRIVWRVASQDAIDFWRERLGAEGVETRDEDGTLVFADPEGLEHQLTVDESGEEQLSADAPDVPGEHGLKGFAGVRVFASDPARSAALLSDTLGFTDDGDGDWTVRGDQRSSFYAYDPPPAERGRQGGGTVHHVAFASQPDDIAAWRERAASANPATTEIIDRFYFRSVYFREPSGVLFEIATIGPGFTADEALEALGEKLSLPPAFEHLRDRLADVLTPLPDPRATRTGA